MQISTQSRKRLLFAALFLARPGLLAPDAFLPVSVVLLGAPVAVAGVMTSRFVARVTKG